MSPQFAIKPILTATEAAELVLQFGLRCDTETLLEAITQAFSDYILLAMSEEIESRQLRDQHYTEAIFYLEKAAKLLKGQPHPAGTMASKLDKMRQTLQKVLANESEIAEERAKRFVELNLVRKLRDVWQMYTNTPFYIGLDGSGRSPHDYLATCFRYASAQYPEITWLAAVNDRAIDYMIKVVRR
ncbi:hypothetical protein [Halioxenophilus sp. WMMB6]|uniref:hypothetical protein n=1 Tax=Halioxenophilus sp. WMMB6 TaxID=3073815 RepID=UPI00295E9EEE|nr:hypothetical protein [Halioxenophilus sp. WMMB6]